MLVFLFPGVGSIAYFVLSPLCEWFRRRVIFLSLFLAMVPREVVCVLVLLHRVSAVVGERQRGILPEVAVSLHVSMLASSGECEA